MIQVPARLYIVQFQGVTISAVQDLIDITPADDKPVCLVEAHITQSSDYGDAQDEGLSISIFRGNATVGSGGSAPTPVPVVASDAAAGFTARVNDTTAASAGTPVRLLSEAANVRVGWHYVPVPEARIVMSQAQVILSIRLNAAPADALVCDGWALIGELG